MRLFTGVMDCAAYVHSCPLCRTEYRFDTITEKSQPSLESAAPKPLERWRVGDDGRIELEYMRTSRHGCYLVATGVLKRHHVANERVQESAEGLVETENSLRRCYGGHERWAAPDDSARHFGEPHPHTAHSHPADSFTPTPLPRAQMLPTSPGCS